MVTRCSSHRIARQLRRHREDHAIVDPGPFAVTGQDAAVRQEHAEQHAAGRRLGENDWSETGRREAAAAQPRVTCSVSINAVARACAKPVDEPSKNCGCHDRKINVAVTHHSDPDARNRSVGRFRAALRLIRSCETVKSTPSKRDRSPLRRTDCRAHVPDRGVAGLGARAGARRSPGGRACRRR